MQEENLHHLNTEDPNYLEYQTQEMSITVLGGIRTDQVDKLRTTLKLETKTQFIHHSLDLYNYHQYGCCKELAIDACTLRLKL